VKRSSLPVSLLCLWLSGVTVVQAASDPDLTLRFAESLMVQHRYREAELEWERLAVEHPQHPRRDLIMRNLLESAFLTNDQEFSLGVARAWMNGPEPCLASVYVVRSLYALGNYPAIEKTAVPEPCSDTLRAERLYWLGLSLTRMKRWDEASAVFAGIQDPALKERSKAASSWSLRGHDLAWKSPAKAGIFSALLPGAGYAYANRPQTAFAAFLINGLFIWGSVSSAKAGNPGLAATLSLFSLGWYSGAIYGSVHAASRENEYQLNRFIQPIERH
jgi:hypothetical protein